MRPTLCLIVLIFTLLVAGGGAAQDAPLNVVATTTILADIAANIGGDRVTVTPLLPPNTDTHAYQFTPQDVALVADADLLLTVGAGYEAFLGSLLENAGAVPTVTASSGVPLLAAESARHAEDEAGATCEADVEHEHDATEEAREHDHGECDPHVWLDPANVMLWADNIAEAFAAADPTSADTYRANAATYRAELETLDAEIRALAETLPEARRVLVTNHNSLNYFAHAYGFKIAATVLPGSSTSAEPNPQELTALIDLIRDESVPAIFAEVSANAQLAEVVGQEAGVAVVTDLYTEALSDAGGPASTYIDYMRQNATTIVNALAEA